MCPANELFYPGDQKDDWICDCRPGYLYHPPSDACWAAYQRGPCATNEYLTLPKNTVIPVCTKNPCSADTLVPFRGQCLQLGSTAPCGVNKFPTEILWVNATTLNIECTQVNIDQQSVSNIHYKPEDIHCCPGCKRYIENKCPSTKS
ncbi:unnamed protein product [Euphydryas editha]|nr:unnamed protein product [Euphydryas editha]